MADQGGIATQSAPKPPGKTTESAPEPPGSESVTRTPEGTTAGDKTSHLASSSDKKIPESSTFAKAAPTFDKAPPMGDKAPTTGDKTPTTGVQTPLTGVKTPPTGDKAPSAAGKSAPAADKAAPVTDKASTEGDKPPADNLPTDGDHAAPSADQPSPTADQPPPAGDRKASADSLLSGSQTPTMESMHALSKIRQLDGIQYSVPVTPDHFPYTGRHGLRHVDVKFREGRTLEQVSDERPRGDGADTVTLNGHTLNFPPSDTFKVEKIQFFSIFGDFFTGSVSIFKKEWPDHMHVTIGHHISAGYHFTIQGTVTPDADKMMMNILRCSEVHDDELLGVVAEFTDPKQLVRRTKQEGVWLEDQVDQDDPFEPGKPFTVEVAVGEQDFHMTVNGKLLPPYKHKVFYGTGHNLCLEKNIKFKCLNVCSISHPKHWEHKLPNILKASILLFDVGIPPPPCNEFKLVLSKDKDDTAEALLIVHALLGKGLVYVYDGTDSNKGDGQKLRVRANRLFSCRVDALADCFKVYVNTLSEVGNSGPFEVKQRFPLTDAAYLNTYGELNNVTVLKAAEDIVV
ncbi:hypothetical protein MRX96_029942 [Rhipicephalus microplus]